MNIKALLTTLLATGGFLVWTYLIAYAQVYAETTFQLIWSLFLLIGVPFSVLIGILTRKK